MTSRNSTALAAATAVAGNRQSAQQTDPHINPPAALPADPQVQQYRYRWKILAIGVLANASFSAAFAGIPVTAIQLRSAYQLDNAALGLALGSLGLGVALSELPWGALTDRWGDRRVLLCGLLSTALALLVLARCGVPQGHVVPPLAVLAAGLMAVGLFGGSVNGSSGRAVMGWFRAGERGLAMSIRQTAVPVGGGIGALLLPGLAVGYGFAAVYAVLAVLCLASAILAWYWLHEPPAATMEGAATAKAGMVRNALRDPQVWRVALAIGILCFPQVSILTFASIYLHDVGHASLFWISGTMAVVQIGAAGMRIWSGHWTDRRGNRRHYLRACCSLTAVLFVALAALVAATAALPVWPQWLLAVMALLLAAAGISASAWHGVAYTELATLAGARQVGTALGLGNTCVFLVFFVTPQAVPALLHWHSWPAVWLAGALIAVLVRPIFLKPV